MAVSYQARNRGAWLGSGWALLATFGVMGGVAVERDAERRVLGQLTGVTNLLSLKPILLLWQAIAYPAVVYTCLAILAAALWRKVPRELIVKGVLACGLTWGASTLLKLVVERPRPPEALTQATNFSFPSGHASNAMAASVVAVVWLTTAYGVRARWSVFAATAFVVLTCADRLFLGVHYPTDVAAGLLLGVLVPAHFHLTMKAALQDEGQPTPTPAALKVEATSATATK